MEGQKPCLRCLLAELEGDEYARSLEDYIKKVPEDKRVDEETYRRRLEQCSSCGRLINAVCLECGCYAELRALKPGAGCPAPEKRWLPEV